MRCFATVVALAIVAACTPIEPVPLSNAPVNHCGCDAHPSTVKCDTATNRCIAGGRPAFAFFIVAHVPDSAYYGAAQTFVLYSGPGAGAPTFTRRNSATSPTFCTKDCAELGGMTLVTSQYRVDASQSKRVNFPLKDRQLIPAHVELEPVANVVQPSAVQPDFPIGLPLQRRFAAPLLGREGAETSTALPSGFYRRTLYPEPPYDALFPPRTSVFDSDGKSLVDRLLLPALVPAAALSRAPDYQALVDEFVLSDATLDPIASRNVTVQREAGLDGWQVWVADSTTKRRISTLKTLSGVKQTLTLETSGETRTPNGGLGDNVEVVVSPPASYVAVPRYVNPVNGGDLGTIRYPSIASPVAVNGRVVVPDSDPLLGFKAKVAFESTNILTQGETRDRSPLLHYSATVSTDDLGRFATVLPPGTYNATIEPVEGTGYAKTTVPTPEVRADLTSNAMTLSPAKRTAVRGRVLLVDQSPVAEATILATPRAKGPTLLQPRPNQTRTNTAGEFSLELDQGSYTITAIPQSGTGFPRVAILSEIPATDTDLSPIQIPAPIALSFTLRDARFRQEDPVVNAVVRVFTVPTGTSTEAIEIGVGATDASGNVEILLAPNPP